MLNRDFQLASPISFLSLSFPSLYNLDAHHMNVSETEIRTNKKKNKKKEVGQLVKLKQ